MTLKAVAARIGRTHANLLHHFGSAAGLQGALAGYSPKFGHYLDRRGSGERPAGRSDPRAIVDRVFDSFDREGAGPLAAWMILTGNRDALDPILETIRDLVAQLTVGHEEHHVAETTLGLVLSALGNALLGEAIANSLGLPGDSARKLTSEKLLSRLAAADNMTG